MANCNLFLSRPTTDITFLPTFNNLSPKFCCEICVKCHVSSTTLKIFNFIKKKKNVSTFCSFIKNKKQNLIFRTLDYFDVDNGIKLFFPTLFFFIIKKKKKKKNTTVTINESISKFVILSSFSLSLSLSLSSTCS